MIKQDWIADLKKTRAKQARGSLYGGRSEGYCCLGRACVTVFGMTPGGVKARANHTGDETISGVFGNSYMEELGLPTTIHESVLTTLNDGAIAPVHLAALATDDEEVWFGKVWVARHTFKEIAHILEQYNLEQFGVEPRKD